MHQLDKANGNCLSLSGKRTIWEAGHYYIAKGPTVWAEAGWQVMRSLAPEADGRMLFIDDVHSVNDMGPEERYLPRIDFSPDPLPTHMAIESQMRPFGELALEALLKLPKRQRARKTHRGWQCAGLSLITDDGRPTCLLLDLGLTWHKRQLGYERACNVIPEFYANEQRGLVRLVARAMPGFDLRVILHDDKGSWQLLD